jgi:enhancer of polycomb-like protein
MSLISDGDLNTDPTIFRFNADKKEPYIPYRLGVQPQVARRDANGRPYPAQPMISQSAQQAQAIMAAANGAQIPIAQQTKAPAQPQPQPQQPQQHLRISANGGMRITAAAASASPPHQQMSPPNSAGLRQNSPPNMASQIPNMPNGAVRNSAVPSESQQQQQVYAVPNGNHGSPESVNGQAGYVQQPKQEPQQQQQAVQPQMQTQMQTQPQMHQQQPQVNGYHAYNAQYIPATSGSTLSVQQMQNLKNVFAAQGGNANQAATAGFVLPTNVNMNLKLPAGRQWASTQHQQQQLQQRPPSAMDGGAVQMNGQMNGVNGVPIRSPSRVQMRPGVQTSPRLQPAQGGY